MTHPLHTSRLMSGRPASLSSDPKASTALPPSILRKMIPILPRRERVKLGARDYWHASFCRRNEGIGATAFYSEYRFHWAQLEKLFLTPPAERSPSLLLTPVSLVSVLAVSGCFSLGAWPLDNDVTGIFRSTQECWKYTKEGLLQYVMTGVFANSPTSLEDWHVHPAAMWHAVNCGHLLS